jgi:hypothetical protein
LVFALFGLTGAILVGNVGQAFVSSGAINNSMSTFGVFSSAINTIYSFDTLCILLYFGLWVISILAAAFLESEALNLPIAVFMGIITIFISFVISNAAHAIATNPIYATVIQHFGQTQLILANLGALTAVFVIIYALVILARPLYTGHAPGSHSTIVVNV